MPVGAVNPHRVNASQLSGASANTPANTIRKPNPDGGKDQGGDVPNHLHDSQPDHPKTKMSMGDKFSQGANIFGAGMSVLPMLKGDPKPPKPPGGDAEGLKGDDLHEFNKYKVLTQVGPPPINW